MNAKEVYEKRKRLAKERHRRRIQQRQQNFYIRVNHKNDPRRQSKPNPRKRLAKKR